MDLIAVIDVIGLPGKLVAGAILGGGVLWFIISSLRAARKTEIQKAAVDAVVVQEIQNKIIVEQIKKDVEVAKDKAVSAAPTDW